MDFEWLLSTLFDASLLSTSSRRRRRLFFVPFRGTSGSRVPLRLPRQLCRKVWRAIVWTIRRPPRHAYSIVNGAPMSRSAARKN